MSPFDISSKEAHWVKAFHSVLIGYCSCLWKMRFPLHTGTAKANSNSRQCTNLNHWMANMLVPRTVSQQGFCFNAVQLSPFRAHHGTYSPVFHNAKLLDGWMNLLATCRESSSHSSCIFILFWGFSPLPLPLGPSISPQFHFSTIPQRKVNHSGVFPVDH